MTNLFSRFSKIANLILLQTTIVVAIGFKNQACAQITSESGNLILERLRSYPEACATGKPSDSYFVKGGVSGLLYPSKCDGLPSGFAEYKFVDTSGTERCTGYASINFAGGRENLTIMFWEVRGAVSGYSCSTIGERYEYRMY